MKYQTSNLPLPTLDGLWTKNWPLLPPELDHALDPINTRQECPDAGQHRRRKTKQRTGTTGESEGSEPSGYMVAKQSRDWVTDYYYSRMLSIYRSPAQLPAAQ